jgi:hypothetical protein
MGLALVGSCSAASGPATTSYRWAYNEISAWMLAAAGRASRAELLRVYADALDCRYRPATSRSGAIW